MKKTKFSITPYEEYSMLGMSENAFNVIDYVTDALKKEKLDVLVIPFQKKAIDGNHDNLMTIAQRYLDMANNAARKRKAAKFSRKHFAELADVDDAEIGILRALVDLIYQGKITALEGFQLDGSSMRSGYKLFIKNTHYYIGIEYPDLWNCIKNTNMPQLLAENKDRENIEEGLALLPRMLSKYLTNKYGLKLIDDFVGLDLTEEVNQAQQLNIEPLISINSNYLPKEWFDSYESHSESSTTKAAYLASMESLKEEHWLKLLNIPFEMRDCFELVGIIEQSTQKCVYEQTEDIITNKETGLQLNREEAQKLIDKIYNIVIDVNFPEDNGYVSKRFWDIYEDLRQALYGAKYEMIEQLKQLAMTSQDNTERKEAKKEITRLRKEVKGDISSRTRNKIKDDIEYTMKDVWFTDKSGQKEAPFNFNVLLANDSTLFGEPEEFPYDCWWPILDKYYGQIEETMWDITSKKLEEYTDDLENNTALFF